MGYWNYYLAWMALTYLSAEPKLLLGLLALVLLRRVLPAPGPILRALRRGRTLREQLAFNPKNVTAARDLAMLELELLRPRSALRHLENALKRSPDDAELHYLAGEALYRLRRHEEALSHLAAAVEKDDRIRFGLPYLIAADALYALGRWEQALEGYEHYAAINSSDLRAYVGIARAHHRLGHKEKAASSIAEALRTYRMLPDHLRQGNRGPLLSAHWVRISMLREPKAIAVGLVAAVAGIALAGIAASALLVVWLGVEDIAADETFDADPDACASVATQAPNTPAHLACIARKATLQAFYDDPSKLELHVATLRAHGLVVSTMNMEGGADTNHGYHLFGYQVAIPGSSEARFLLFNGNRGHRSRLADYVDEALSPPIKLSTDGHAVVLRDGQGRSRVRPLTSDSPCAEEHPPDAGGEQAQTHR